MEENHPIPQDITGFQFKLIGFMTVRQFVYIAAAIIFGWFISFLLPIPHIISWPISLIIITISVIFALVPVDGRPMDTMLANLFRAMLAPTQYVYNKQGGNINNINPQTLPASQQSTAIPLPAPTPLNQTPSSAPLMQTVEVAQNSSPAPAAPMTPSQVVQAHSADPIKNQPTAAEYVAQTMPLHTTPTPDSSQLIEEEKKIDAETVELVKQIEANKTSEQSNTGDQTVAMQKIAELEKMLADAIRQKEDLEREVLKINAKLDHQADVVVKVAPATPQPTTPNEPRVKQITPNQGKSEGMLDIPEFPNLITGIVKDPRGNPLQNILVEVKDQEDNPVRAFKTNGLGQFASATSLSNGKYFLSFEDPKEENKFDTVEIEATGSPILPIEVVSVDKREELRRELFN